VAVADGPGSGDLVTPPDRALGQRVEQDPAQVTAQHLGAPPGAVVGLVEQHRAVLVEHPRRLATLVDDRAELVDEPGRVERGPAVVLVNVELSALRACPGRGIGVVHRGLDAVDVQNAGEGEAAQAGTDDRDSCAHRVLSQLHWNAVPDIILEHCSSHVKMVGMAAKTQRTQRRTDALSKERIVEAAIEILDAQGETALTFRALTARLATGSGAIYWHVANKDELLAATTADVIARAVSEVSDPAQAAEPKAAIRAVALAVFDAIDAHPWVGTQLSRAPWQSAMLQILEGIGGQLRELGVPEQAQFDAASALVHYILGIAAQYAAGARLLLHETDRPDFLATVAARWMQHDPAKYPFVHQIAGQLPEHDDREQFLAGIDLILAGIDTTR
jgi:AcrR family transcriptional regulator